MQFRTHARFVRKGPVFGSEVLTAEAQRSRRCGREGRKWFSHFFGSNYLELPRITPNWSDNVTVPRLREFEREDVEEGGGQRGT
jgi:hypothetical protein